MQRAARIAILALATGASALAGACRSSGAGLETEAAISDAGDDGLDLAHEAPVAAADAAAGDAPPTLVPEVPPADPALTPAAPPTIEPWSTELPRTEDGAPGDVGCADGTREGFLDFDHWPWIAGCAGGFRIPGLGFGPGQSPQCQREAGNTGADPSGVGCSVADLCAPGWHVCADAAEVASRSDSGCEGAVPAGFALFFAVRAGASADGICAPGLDFRNDVHGCGSFGEPTHATCAPLDHKLSVTLCRTTGGLWSCGSTDDHLQETEHVSKPGPALGGALCCRGPD